MRRIPGKTKVVDQGLAKPDYGFFGSFLVVRNIGKSFIYPIAILPFAAILIRFGILFELCNVGNDSSLYGATYATMKLTHKIL